MNLLPEVRQRLAERALESVRDGAERYFKHEVRFHGVKAEGVRQVAREVLPSLKGRPVEAVIGSAFGLLASEMFEEKQIAVIVLNRHAHALPGDFIRQLEPVFDRNVYDWATCDMLCGRVLYLLIKRSSAELRRVVGWSKAKYLWRQRASAVTFVKVARFGQHDEEVIAVCDRVLRNPERFAQLGAGWALRELSLADCNRVVAFLRNNYAFVSREGLRYAIEKMPASLQRRLLAEHKRR